MTQYSKLLIIYLLGPLSFLLIFGITKMEAQQTQQSPFFMRFKIVQPSEGKFKIASGGYRHMGGKTWSDWYFPNVTTNVSGGTWSNWMDMTNYPWHEKLNRAGGIAEFPSIRLAANLEDSITPVNNCTFAVQLADAPDEKNVLVSFTENSESNTIIFLAPYPLREHFKEFETGSQMTARHSQWAKEVIGEKPPVLKKFDIITQFWGTVDPSLERQNIETLKLLGFNVIGNINPKLAREAAMRTYGYTWLYAPEPEFVEPTWKSTVTTFDQNSEDGKWKYQSMPHWVISDEVSGVDIINVPTKYNKWFRDYLRSKGLTDKDLGQPIDEVEYPAKAMYEPTLPQNAPLQTRKIMYYAGKFGQWWSAKQLRQINDLIRETFPGKQTEILLPSHGFLGNAWNAYNLGFSYRMLDIFEVGQQESVTQFSTEDWLGLNYMYWTDYTWTGGQTFAYLNALTRSAADGHPIMLRGLLTNSDEKYLRLKAFSSLGQGAKSFFYWTYGPTYIGTENYWSDIRGMYHGIAKVNRDLEKSEDIIFPAKTVTDPVAILYSVSHDLWNTNNQGPFVEKRLLWHALRHLQVQPNFLREEDVEGGKLKDYKVLYITDRCITRKASEAINKWVKDGGILYLAAGAATRDEFNEPYLPPFAKTVWGERAAERLVNELHNYNERVDLPKIKPLTTVNVNYSQQTFNLPVIGSRLDLSENSKKFATFADGQTAGTITEYNKGQIIAVGFMPMLAYGQLANFKPTTLEEKWTPEPRMIIKMALDAAKIVPVAEANVPVVETNLLTGNEGSAIVLANYTYQPIKSLTIDLKLSKPFKQAVSIEGKQVNWQKIDNERIRLQLPLEWTDIILLR
ncbi:MAG TPA: hypothetical protein PKY82_24550 [Pyrinomonadaceae bacterium]|nr:hypothetical protein [Pyrinomonadaceae bacterium]